MNGTQRVYALAFTTICGIVFSTTSLATVIDDPDDVPGDGACSEPDPGGDLECGDFLGIGSELGTTGNGGNAEDPLYWDGDSFGDSASGFTKYDQVSKWDADDGGKWSKEVGTLGVTGEDSDGDPLWGTWEFDFGVDLVVIKGADDHAIYSVNGEKSGDWSVYWGMPENNGGNIPALSNISFYSSVPVPTPATFGILGLGLLMIGSARRFMNVRRD